MNSLDVDWEKVSSNEKAPFAFGEVRFPSSLKRKFFCGSFLSPLKRRVVREGVDCIE